MLWTSLSMRCRAIPCLALIGCMGFVSSTRAAEWLVFPPPQWQIKLEFETAKKSATNNDSSETRFEEELELKFNGYTLDPKIANYSLALSPVWIQGKYEFPDREETLNAHRINYDLNFNVFSGTPGPFGYNGKLVSTSSSSDYSFGGITKFSNKLAYVQSNWRNRFFPATFSFTQQSQEQTYQSGITKATSHRKDQLQTFRIKGQSSKTKINLEHNDFDDQVSNRSFTEAKAYLDHNAKWGKGSYLNSTLSLSDKNAATHYKNLYVAENARLQHTHNLYSTYRFSHSSQAQEFHTRQNYAELGLTHHLYRNLITNAMLSGATISFNSGKQSEQGARINLNYNKRFSRKIALTTGLGTGYQLANREATGGLLEVIGNSQTVDSTRVFTLNERFIDTGTIVITDASGLVTYSEGVDYGIFPIGNNLTEIQVLPGGLINVGDTVLVYYQYASMPSMKFSTTTYNFNATLNYDSYTFFFRHYQTDQTLKSGDVSGYLTDRRNSTWGLHYRYSRFKTFARLGVEWQRYQSGDFSSDTTTLKQSAGHTFSPRVSFALTANEVFSKTEERKFDLYNIDLSFNLRHYARLTVTPKVGAWWRDETGVEAQRFFAASLDMRWIVRKLILSANIKHNSWNSSTSDTKENRLMFTIIRKSR